MKAQISRIGFLQIVTLALLVGSMGKARADFLVVSESAVFNTATQNVLFTIEFNQAPDFFTTNQFGAQTNSFQYFIVGDPSLPYPDLFDSIIRGEEIHITMDMLRVRNSAPPDPDPAAGGWGSIRGSVPFTLSGNILTFSIPLQLISDHSVDGNFTYRLEWYQEGAVGGGIDNQSKTLTPPFAAFRAKLEIELRPRIDDAFELQSTFTLGIGSNGIDPLTEDVTLELTGGTGSFTTTIPAGSFTKDKKRRFEFEGTINGVELQAKITRLARHQFKCKVEGEHAALTGIANPVRVILTIGDDSGSTTVRAKFEHHEGDHGDGEDGEHEHRTARWSQSLSRVR